MGRFHFESIHGEKNWIDLIYQWRLDPLTRQNSFRQYALPRTEFESEFKTSREKGCLHYLVFENQTPLAYLRFDPTAQRKDILISINLSPQWRGQGLGSAILQESSDWIREKTEATRIIAEVKTTNPSSIRAFINGGYARFQSGSHIVQDTQESIPIFRFQKWIRLGFRPRAIFFDFDGTLIQSLIALKDVFHKVCEELQIPSSHANFEDFNGPSLSEISQRLSLLSSSRLSAPEIERRYMRHIEAIYDQVSIEDQTLSFIDFALSQDLQLALVSSNQKRIVERVLSRHQLNQSFSLILSGEDVTQSKPHPEIYEKALSELKISPQEVVAVEDSQAGIKSALQTGVFVFGLNHFEGSESEMLRFQRLFSLEEVRPYL